MTDIFSVTIEGIKLLHDLIEKAKVAAEAQVTVDRLKKESENSIERIKDVRQQLDSAPPDEEVKALKERMRTQMIPDIDERYNQINNKLKGYIDEKQDRRKLSKLWHRAWKGGNWAKDESDIRDLMGEIRSAEDRISQELQLLALHSQQKALERQKKMDDGLQSDRFIRAIRQLQVQKEPNPRSFLEKLSKSPPDWILDETLFQSWQRRSSHSEGSWLWIVGEAGVGKSHLATFLFDQLKVSDVDEPPPPYSSSEDLKDQDEKSQSSQDVDEKLETAAAIYYCRYNSEDNTGGTQGINRILECLLRQVLEKLRLTDPEELKSLMSKVEKVVDRYETSVETSAHSLLRLVSTNFSRVYLMVDGLDELPEATSTDLIARLQNLRAPNVSYVVTCRRGFFESRQLQQPHFINADKNEGAIRAFVMGNLGNESSEDVTTIPEKKIEELARKILDIADRNFLCANLLVQYLNSMDPSEWEGTLNDFTGGLHGLIEQLFRRIDNLPDGYEKQMGYHALIWVTYTRDSLTFEELQHALSYSIHSDKEHLHEFTKAKLTKATSYFLSIGGDSDYVSIHKAVKDYCESGKVVDNIFKQAHAIIARTCLGCLQDSDEKAGTLDQWRRAVRESPLIQYAASNWGWHLEKAQDKPPEQLFARLDPIDVLQRDLHLDAMTIGILPQLQEMGIWRDEMWDLLKTPTPPISALHILAFFNLSETAKNWINKGNPVEGFETPSDGQTDFSPLYIAATRGNLETVNMLLSLGADPSKPNGRKGLTAFAAAVKAGQQRSVASLIKNAKTEHQQAMVSVKGPGGHYPLVEACGSISYPGDLKMVQKILEVMEDMPNGLDILLNRGGPKGGTALHRAAEANEPEIVKLLLAFPHSERLKEVRNNSGSTAINNAGWACWKGAAEAIQQLLDGGCDPNSQNDRGMTAIHQTAIHEGHIDWARTEGFKVLLPVSDLSIRNRRGRTPLHFACEHGRPNHVAAMGETLDRNRELCFIKDNPGHTPLGLASIVPYEGSRLKIRQFRGRMRCAAHLIPRMGDRISKDEVKQLLETSLQHNQGRILGLLLDHCPAAKALFETGDPPLQKAIRSGGDTVVEAVITRYSDEDLKDLNDPRNKDLLLQVAQSDHPRVTKVLVDQGVKLDERTGHGSTLRWCSELCSANVVNAIWAQTPDALKPNEFKREVLDFASAQNPVRKLWRENGFLPDENSQFVECLSSEKDTVAVVFGDKSTEKDNAHRVDQETSMGARRGVYLKSEPIPQTAKMPISKIKVCITGKDQGWSDAVKDHPQDKGTINHSETCFCIAIKRDGHIINECEIARNLLNVDNWTTYEIVWDGIEGPHVIRPENISLTKRANVGDVKTFINSIRRGDRIFVVAKAQFYGWECWVQGASVKVYYED